MIEILCDDSTCCKEACDNNNDYHGSRQRRTFNMSVKSMRISLDHFIYCKKKKKKIKNFIVMSCTNVKLSFLFVGLYLALYAHY